MRRQNLDAALEGIRRTLPTLRRATSYLPASLRYLFTTEVHAYAFSIAANVYLSFFPFTLMLLVVCRKWLHWEGAYNVVLDLLRVHLPVGAGSVVRNLSALVEGHRRLQILSVLMLLFTSSGVFLPLEIALNRVWGFTRNRNFFHNQLVSFLLAVLTGLLTLFSVLLTTAIQEFFAFFYGWIPSQGLGAAISRGLLEIVAVPLAVSIYFAIYYFLPNGPVPVRRVFPAAIVVGVLMEIAKFVYMETLPLFRFREVYGPFALSVTLLFWAFVGALILLLGAHLSAQNLEESHPTAEAARVLSSAAGPGA